MYFLILNELSRRNVYMGEYRMNNIGLFPYEDRGLWKISAKVY